MERTGSDLDAVDRGPLVAAATAAAGSVEAALALAADVAPGLPQPGGGSTLARWAALAALTCGDVAVGRVVEPHCDAVAILAEAGEPCPEGRWGVFAAERAGTVLAATPAGAGWVLEGTKPWCSLAGMLDAALVTAVVDGGRQLFAVALDAPGVDVEPAGAWVATGLHQVPATAVRFDRVTARPVGPPGWYLRRPGFRRGGIGVAACWYGGAEALLDRLRLDAPDDDLSNLGVGRAGLALGAAADALARAATAVDAGRDDDELALRARAVVAGACAEVVRTAEGVLGPTPACFDAGFATRVADLRTYLGQHHAERDLVALGRSLRR